jgi:hypothetical protein
MDVSVSAVLEQDRRHAQAAENQSGGDGTEEENGFMPLFPRRLPAKNHSAQQVDRGVFWFDNYSIVPIPRMSMSKWIYLVRRMAGRSAQRR